MGVDDSVIGADIAEQELLHDVGNIREILIKRAQLFLCFHFHRAVGADTDVRLHDYRVAHLVREGLSRLEIRNDVLTGRRNTCVQEDTLHLGLPYDIPDILLPGADSDIEIRAEPRILRKPVLIQGVEPVDPAVLMDIERNSTEDFVVILQGMHIVILRQRVFQLAVQRVIRHIADPEHIDSELMQPVAELGAGNRVCR